MTNSLYFSETTFDDMHDAREALAEGVRGALVIATEEIHDGAVSAAVEIAVDDAAGNQVRRSAVSISVAPLASGPVPQHDAPSETTYV